MSNCVGLFKLIRRSKALILLDLLKTLQDHSVFMVLVDFVNMYLPNLKGQHGNVPDCFRERHSIVYWAN